LKSFGAVNGLAEFEEALDWTDRAFCVAVGPLAMPDVWRMHGRK
jgi:hypothetical protein